MKRTKLVYLLGKNEKELLADDEYDSEGGKTNHAREAGSDE